MFESRGAHPTRAVPAVLPASGPLAPRELEPTTVRAKCSAGPKLGRRDV